MIGRDWLRTICTVAFLPLAMLSHGGESIKEVIATVDRITVTCDRDGADHLSFNEHPLWSEDVVATWPLEGTANRHTFELNRRTSDENGQRDRLLSRWSTGPASAAAPAFFSAQTEARLPVETPRPHASVASNRLVAR